MGSCFCLFLLDWCSPLLSFALLPYFPTIARVGRDGRVYEVLSFHLNSRTSRVVSRFFSLDFSFPFSFLLLLLLPPRPLSSAVLLAAVQPVAPNSSSDTALSITPSNSALFPRPLLPPPPPRSSSRATRRGCASSPPGRTARGSPRRTSTSRAPRTRGAAGAAPGRWSRRTRRGRPPPGATRCSRPTAGSTSTTRTTRAT